MGLQGRRIKRSEQAGVEMIRRYESSGLSTAAICEAEGISKAVYYFWKKRSRQLMYKQEESPLGIYPIRIAEEGLGQVVLGINITYLNGVPLQIDAPLDIETLASLISLSYLNTSQTS